MKSIARDEIARVEIEQSICHSTAARVSSSRATRKAGRAAALAVLAVLFVSSASMAERWFHVRVVEEGDNGTKINVNLPLSLIESVLGMIPEELNEEMQVELNESGFEVNELRDLWKQVRDSADATYVTVEGDDETVRVRKEGQYLIAETTELRERGARVDVRFPLEVVDALFSGPEGQIDLGAAVRALAEHGDGDMVTVNDGDTTVRVWVDDQNEPID